MSSELCPRCGQAGFIPPGPCDFCGAIVCPNSSCDGLDYVSPGPCSTCGYTEKQTLVLSLEDGSVVRRANLKKLFDRRWAQSIFPDEAKYWDSKCQYEIDFEGSEWFVFPNPSASNETLQNGVAITEVQPLAAGDRLAVGRESKSIEKSILIVSFQ